MSEDFLLELRRSALSLLARREHSEKELLVKLQQKHSAVEEQFITVLALLKTEGLLSDQRFAESYVRSRVAKGFGRIRIALELREKGVAAELAEQVLQSFDNDWLNLAYKVWQKKYTGAPQSFSERAKQANFLRYRGFSSEDIDQLFSSLPTTE